MIHDAKCVRPDEVDQKIEAAKEALRAEVVEALRAEGLAFAADHLSRPKVEAVELPTMDYWRGVLSDYKFDLATAELYNLARAIVDGRAEVVLKEKS